MYESPKEKPADLQISVAPWEGRTWRATMRLPGDMKEGRGVSGSSTEEGPWTEGVGETPAQAVDALMTAIGLAYVTAKASKENR